MEKRWMARGAAIVVALGVTLAAAPGDAPQTPRTLFGMTVSTRPGESAADARARIVREFGEPPIVRLFSPGPPERWPVLLEKAGDSDVVASFKIPPDEVLSGEMDAELQRWFDAAPDDRDVYWVYFHEPEDNVAQGSFSASAYVDAWRHIDEIAAGSSSTGLISTIVLMCWTLEPDSGRDWSDYVPADTAPDVLAWDCYNRRADDGKYETVRGLFGATYGISEGVGAGWAIAETGSPLASGDDGRRRARWIRSLAEYATERRAVFVTYFNTVARYDFELNDEPSQTAWREVMAVADR